MVTRAQYFASWVDLGTRSPVALGIGSVVAWRYADGLAVKLHGLGVVLKMSAMGLASASFMFIGGSPRTSSMVRKKFKLDRGSDARIRPR